MYSNDHFQSVKLGADLFLIEAVVADPKSLICFYKSGKLLLLQIGT